MLFDDAETKNVTCSVHLPAGAPLLDSTFLAVIVIDVLLSNV